MSGLLAQIKTAFEVENMTPEQIAQDLQLDETAVKAALIQCSSVYRKMCKQEDDSDDGLNFSSVQLRDVNKVIYELAIGAEDEHIRAKMATYIRDDKKGRKEIIKTLNGSTFNILQFNQQIQSARSLADEAKKKLIVDVKTTEEVAA